MGTFESEMCRRLWWCIYLLDRRLAIETGRPFLIQDVNVDVGFPQDVSDEWLRICHDSQSSVPNAASGANISSPVPYLIAMTAYSTVIGKVWEALYGASTTESTPSHFINEYLMHLITQSQKEIQREFTYDPYSPTECRTEGLAWWQVKQQLIMRIRWSALHLLIRKPMLHRTLSHQQSSSETIENEVMCMNLARSIIEDFSNVPEEHPKYTFPFLQYLTGATITALGLIIKQPSFKSAYGDLTLEAARSLENHCRMTWVSGRMARAVWKLNQMATATLGTVTRASLPSEESHHNQHRNFPTMKDRDLPQESGIQRQLLKD
ncbi:uncharacterized protein PFLUO_LOCUS3355 [Penicillium psychrofluorescens]|uniref:uncharacterized protein n=1 Tax=Penicillium psychrofluorescens TaxID=3158075 RepID=UPI003CCD11EC